MREIEFRGKRKDNGEWAFGDLIKNALYTDKAYIALSSSLTVSCLVFVEVIPETVGQYTGQNDEDGKKIFKDDIVIMHYFYEDFDRGTLGVYEAENEVIGIVGIDNFGKYTQVENEEYYWLNYLEDPDAQLKVIGNIHDNPELIKKAL